MLGKEVQKWLLKSLIVKLLTAAGLVVVACKAPSFVYVVGVTWTILSLEGVPVWPGIMWKCPSCCGPSPVLLGWAVAPEQGITFWCMIGLGRWVGYPGFCQLASFTLIPSVLSSHRIFSEWWFESFWCPSHSKGKSGLRVWWVSVELCSVRDLEEVCMHVCKAITFWCVREKWGWGGTREPLAASLLQRQAGQGGRALITAGNSGALSRPPVGAPRLTAPTRIPHLTPPSQACEVPLGPLRSLWEMLQLEESAHLTQSQKFYLVHLWVDHREDIKIVSGSLYLSFLAKGTQEIVSIHLLFCVMTSKYLFIYLLELFSPTHLVHLDLLMSDLGVSKL